MTSIEWTEETWNPIRGCSRVSPGCEHCYAESIAARFSGPGQAYEALAEFRDHEARWTRHVRLVSGALDLPIRWKLPRSVFVNSMGDLFHESLPFETIAAVFGVIAQTPRHSYQVLTKREKRMASFFAWLEGIEADHGPPPDVVCTTCASNLIDIDAIQTAWPLPNLILGVSVEDQIRADLRLPVLSKLKGKHAQKTMASYEPALGPVVFGDNLPDWVIFGGESGAGARDCHLEWAFSAQRECAEAGSAFFMKQAGKRPHLGGDLLKIRKKGDYSVVPEALRVRQYP